MQFGDCSRPLIMVVGEVVAISTSIESWVDIVEKMFLEPEPLHVCGGPWRDSTCENLFNKRRETGDGGRIDWILLPETLLKNAPLFICNTH